ncbi:H-NS family nucleoid-associated regulatory protein [Actibacterium ureilyticum]|uniref:H-NS histone family protein n=1 Tax=Actibacterium ureilyticum TaxID=1590614 RepID=UPI000BAAE795|nr:H-NS histone family protein [Actibacterium ureilyticum]
MKKDLKTMSRKELLDLRIDIDTALTELAEQEKQKALDAAEKAAQVYGYSLSELTNGKKVGKKAAKSKLPAKYHDPENPDATWSGRGRQPDWFKSAIAAGKAPEDLEI